MKREKKNSVFTGNIYQKNETVESRRHLNYNALAMRRPARFVPGLIGFVLLVSLSFSYSPQEVALNLENKLASLRSLQADFEHDYFSASLATPLLEKGKFYLQKPSLMRWEYQSPEQNIYIYKEGLSLAYFPEDNQLFRHALSAAEEDTPLFAILTGRAKLADNYLIEPADFPSDNKAPVQIKLTPRQEGELSYILLEVDEKTWFIDKIVLFDWAGNKQEFRFRRFRANPRLSGKTFELEVPPDCEVIEDLPPLKK